MPELLGQISLNQRDAEQRLKMHSYAKIFQYLFFYAGLHAMFLRDNLMRRNIV